ncbi:Similar to EG45-like domain containing protein; acc. no. Q9ZP41 [Pyronema omphalodes CBS 100304]|uniref:Similar to EG45-like domain containing protein acc. no. Q9ZP41 n=1 Tax=Pyronema omphalodes (strain CBS 100304) TaxID=1076935 RepID=U4LHZ7_PYROM|nr:Similar to EG45-like domain containing protein; acc. no. Q9ZP41 [Pyronema omphalodes CBS 100304]
MVRRLSEFKQKLHPNAKLRAWYQSHTFGGTTKAKSLKILGFSKQNFYYVAAGVAALLIIAAVGGGIGVKTSLRSAKIQGANEGIVGQPAVAKTTQSRVRTLVSNGQTILKTETTAYVTTFTRGAGITQVVTTNEKGEKTTVQASMKLITNSEGSFETQTLIGSLTLVPGQGGVSEQTIVFGEPSVITNDQGQLITTTVFNTDNSQPTGGTAKDSTTAAATATPGASPTGATTGAASTNTAAATSTAATSSKSDAKPSTSASPGGGDGGGGGGEEFEGEATFYAPGLGSCGTDATDADYVAALSKVLFDATGVKNSNANPYCGRKALVKAAGGKRRRWDNLWNMTTHGSENWEKSRSERWSRRSMISAGTDGLDHPTRAWNRTKNRGWDIQFEEPAPPGITPPPGPETDLWERQAGGGGVTITVVDRCPVCKQYDLDLSPAAYNVLGNPDAGRIAIKWKWLD